MQHDEFRRHAHALVDWMADYLDRVETLPVRAQVRPGEVAASLAEAAPEHAEPFEDVFADFERDIMPGMTHWQHPAFFAYFPANTSPPSVLAEMLAATVAAQCMLWQTSPAATELETRVLDWLRQLLGLPAGFAGVIQPTASDATLCALLTARERATGWQSHERGLAAVGARVVAYASDEAHSSVEKAAMLAGYGRELLRPIASDDAFAMRPEALAAAIDRDRADGLTPACVVATLGTTGTGGVDPLAAVAAVCRERRVYLHVDAAWAGSALIVPERRWMIEGVEGADSVVLNPHKWLLTNFDCSAHYVRDPAELVRTFAVHPSYLQSREAGAVTDYRDWGIPLGRRFRALKLWFVLRCYGAQRLREMIEQHIAWAQELARDVDASPEFELCSPPSLALFSFRFRRAGASEGELETLNQRLLEAVNDGGALYLTQNRVRGRYAIRFQVGARLTTRAHVRRGWDAIRAAAAAL